MSLQEQYSRQFEIVLKHLNIEEENNYILLRSLIIRPGSRNMSFGSLILENLKADAGIQGKALICKLGTPAWKLRKWYLKRGLFSFTDQEGYEYMVHIPKSIMIHCKKCEKRLGRYVLEENNLLIYTCTKCRYWISGGHWLEYRLLENKINLPAGGGGV
jgi:hypothetical protein